METSKIKCRKCRGYLMNTTCMISSHNTAITSEVDTQIECDEENTSTVWFVDPDQSPEWVKSGINKGEWSSGKLDCPHCNGRLGSFNFVQPRKCKCSKYILPPVWMMKSRVDVAIKQPIKKTPFAKPRVLVDNTWPIMDHPCPPSQNKNGSKVELLGENDSVTSANHFVSSHSALPCLASSVDSTTSSTSFKRSRNCHKKPSEKLFLKQWRKLLHLKKYQDEVDLSESKHVHEKFNCPVCLELYFLPTECYPCGHMFCEPCLRCWNKQIENSTQCPCPICRAPIKTTVPNTDIGVKLRRAFPLLYRSRKKQLAKMFRYPLPSQRRPFTAEDFNFQGVGAIYSIVASVFIYAILFQLFQLVLTE